MLIPPLFLSLKNSEDYNYQAGAFCGYLFCGFSNAERIGGGGWFGNSLPACAFFGTAKSILLQHYLADDTSGADNTCGVDTRLGVTALSRYTAKSILLQDHLADDTK